jgi:hypothetical protein
MDDERLSLAETRTMSGIPPEVARFADLAEAFCRFVDSANESPLEERLRTFGIMIAELYATGLTLPDVEPTDEERAHMPNFPPPVEFERFARYWEVYDSYEQEEPLMTTLTNDIETIHNELWIGLVLFRQGDEAAITDGVWWWRFTLYNDLGEAATGALRAIHWALHRLEMDEDETDDD